MKKFYDKYKHAIPMLVYMGIYCVWFAYVEKKVTRPSTVIHMKMDDAIPFCEVFIIPYLLWFVYVTGTVLYFFFKNKQEYYRICTFLAIGMTVFLVISTLWPNGHHLRPYAMPRDNVFTMLVSLIYRMDTPTNIWPSIHVFNSIGAHLAIVRNQNLAKNKWIHIGSLVLCISIILSTVFIKQHSLFDVITAFLMAAVLYIVVYQADLVGYCQMIMIVHRKNRQVRRV